MLQSRKSTEVVCLKLAPQHDLCCTKHLNNKTFFLKYGLHLFFFYVDLDVLLFCTELGHCVVIKLKFNSTVWWTIIVDQS